MTSFHRSTCNVGVLSDMQRGFEAARLLGHAARRSLTAETGNEFAASHSNSVAARLTQGIWQLPCRHKNSLVVHESPASTARNLLVDTLNLVRFLLSEAPVCAVVCCKRLKLAECHNPLLL